MILIAWHAFQNQQASILKEEVGFIVQRRYYSILKVLLKMRNSA
jgi:hypothetical protein